MSYLAIICIKLLKNWLLFSSWSQVSKNSRKKKLQIFSFFTGIGNSSTRTYVRNLNFRGMRSIYLGISTTKTNKFIEKEKNTLTQLKTNFLNKLETNRNYKELFLKLFIILQGFLAHDCLPEPLSDGQESYGAHTLSISCPWSDVILHLMSVQASDA